MRSDLDFSGKTSTKRGRGLFFFFICLLAFVASFFVGCNEKDDMKENLILTDFADTYYISENASSFLVQFAFSDIIEHFEITDIQASNGMNFEWNFVAEKDSDKKPLMIEKYYIYGIVFDLKSDSDFTWQSFTLTIDEDFTETVDVNIDVKVLNTKHEGDDIRPISTPFIGGFVSEAEWIFLPMNDITISSIELKSSASSKHEILVNSVEFTGDRAVEKLDKFYIKVLFPEYESADKLDKIYMKIKYTKDEEDHTYISDYSVFGDQLKLLTNKIKAVSE